MYNLPTSEELRRYRLKAGMTQSELARSAGLSQSLIARIEAGGVDPRLSTMGKILHALKAGKETKEVCAENIMKAPVIHVKPSDTVATANKLMAKYGISQLPVLQNDVQIGSISEARIVQEVSSTANHSKISVKKVEDVMSDGFPTVGRKTDVRTISRLVEIYPAVLVVEKGRTAGIITKADVIKLVRGS